MFGDLARLNKLMIANGVTRVVAKRLAKNDNSKQQIYLGSNFEVLNILPFGKIYEDSSDKNQILKAPLNFRWLQPDGSVTPAPGAQLILYPQYPEVRMSGFLQGAKNAPNEVLNSREAGRVLFFGIGQTGEITAVVVPPDDALAKEFEVTVAGQRGGVFYELSVGVAGDDTKAKLLLELKRIASNSWIASKRLLGDGTLAPCESSNCGGYTLEAELGVKPNGFAEPDYLGWEVKQHSVTNLEKPTRGGPVTLMTPEPTGGYYKDKGVEAFVRKYGYADTKGREDRLNFGGVFRVGAAAARTKLTLTLDGYDAGKNKLTDVSKGIALVDQNGNLAAVWNYTGLIEHWKRKHERAVYVPSMMRKAPQREYRFSKQILLGQETDFFRFLKAMASGHVYYDPGIKLEGASTAKPRAKRRSQFRIGLAALPLLYTRIERTQV